MRRSGPIRILHPLLNVQHQLETEDLIEKDD